MKNNGDGLVQGYVTLADQPALIEAYKDAKSSWAKNFMFKGMVIDTKYAKLLLEQMKKLETIETISKVEK